jgi:hypothetical protein
MYTNTCPDISIRIMWLFCTGMRFGNEALQAEYELTRLRTLGANSIVTSRDIDAVNGLLNECALHLSEASAETRIMLEQKNPFFRDTNCTLEAA